MFKRSIILFVIITFISSYYQPVYAQGVSDLPVPGTMVNLSPAFEPVLIKGLKVHPDNPFLFDFIIDTGNTSLQADDALLKEESNKLIKYFLAAMTVPEKDLWVNLSPYEKDRVIAPNLGQTEMGRDMLAQDYILKQLTASLIYPEKHLGKEFWDRVYAKARQMYGTTQIPVNTFNKVWIVADKADVFERGNVAYVVGAHLKVMLEEDYLALQKHVSLSKNNVIPASSNVIPAKAGIQNKINSDMDPRFRGDDKEHIIASQIIREVILPEIEHEVNAGKNFAPLRQMFYSMILASWYKMALKDAILTQIYGNQSKVKVGVNQDDPKANEEIFQRYLKAYKKGVFNYIKEDVDNSLPTSSTVIPAPYTVIPAKAGIQTIARKYFSGGALVWGDLGHARKVFSIPEGTRFPNHAFIARVNTIPQRVGPDAAMKSQNEKKTKYEWPLEPDWSDPDVFKRAGDAVKWVNELRRSIESRSQMGPVVYLLPQTYKEIREQLAEKFSPEVAEPILVKMDEWGWFIKSSNKKDEWQIRSEIKNLEKNLQESFPGKLVVYQEVYRYFPTWEDALRNMAGMGLIDKQITPKEALLVGNWEEKCNQFNTRLAQRLKNLRNFAFEILSILIRITHLNSILNTHAFSNGLTILSPMNFGFLESTQMSFMDKRETFESMKKAFPGLQASFRQSKDALDMIIKSEDFREYAGVLKKFDGTYNNPVASQSLFVYLLNEAFNSPNASEKNDFQAYQEGVGLLMSNWPKFEQTMNEFFSSDPNVLFSKRAGTRPADKEMNVQPDNGKGKGRGSAIQNRKILVVEDDPGIRKSMDDALKYNGARVVAAQDAPEALKFFEEAETQGEPFDLLITDDSMPKISGRELLQRIRAHSKTPAVLMSGNLPENPSLTLAKIEGPLIATLSKPFSVGELLRVVTEQLADGAMSAEARSRPKVLIVNDIPNSRGLFSSWGGDFPAYEFTVVNFEEAEALIRGGQGAQFALMITDTDNKLGPTRGPDLFRLTRQSASGLPVVITSVNPNAVKEYPPDTPFYQEEDIYSKLGKVVQEHARDLAMTPGGIDLDRGKMRMNVTKDAAMGGVVSKFDPAQIARIKRDGFDGLEFKIESIVPVTDLPLILGLSARQS